MEFAQTFSIPAERVSGLRDRVTESHKRAVKVGVEGMGLVVGQTETRTHIINGIEVPRKYTEVTISGLTPKFEGWHFRRRRNHRAVVAWGGMPATASRERERM